MRVKVVVEKEIEIEINDNDFVAWAESFERENQKKAIDAVEKAIGLPFGCKNETTTEFISGVYTDTDEEPILQW